MSDERPPGEWLTRAAETIGVDYPNRMVELIVMPYNERAMVPFRGRVVAEEIAPGAFDGIEKRANRVRVNRDHDVRRTVGRAVAFYPARPEGLVGRVKISRTELGDETLELAHDGNLDASAAFLPMGDATQWLDRNTVRYSKCWLGHIALTPEPAYEGARVLAVRHTEPPGEPPATPNLDRVRAWILEDRYSQI